ncbi:hypothetical protein L484_014187 [Morus notabilis]|uniref:F-box protein n=1 Tax=Morus notabilis TaxID=981085 RepID=W9R9F4_9ROSA|nr:probable F-box protein At4g22030 [Morus notabilis]XP_010099188.1 probable F-box protein At4g22030 [Morus notabilis]EXB77059.1 hypothetical protein L484_014186 [Morus notabilis]EXB77060.1 hypothetical protein L484_014187 [Morus notabilis]
MATLLSSTVFSVKGTSQIHDSRRSNIRATINIPKTPVALPKLPSKSFADNLENITSRAEQIIDRSYTRRTISPNLSNEKAIIEKMYAIMEAVADRVEMHNNIGAQRDNWNTLLLTSVNSITLTAATMTGISAAATAVSGSSAEALKLGATILYLAATGLLAVMNKIQPSQLAEEQRNASRLFKQLLREIETKLSLGNVTSSDVNEAMERVLALDKAYPLPLLGAMLEKFPKKVEPAVWWPRKVHQKRVVKKTMTSSTNGWSEKLEEEMREICGVIERKDLEDYLRLSKKALNLNKVLAISGPVLTGLAALGTAFSHHGTVPLVAGVVGGALASVVNSFEHGGQVGMVFEMYRSNAGFFRLVEETIESNLNERDFERRENGEVFETKVALQLGRSLSELRNLADNSRNSRSRRFNGVDHHDREIEEEFASKLF